MKENEPAALGDTVVMDFKGYVDGKEFEGGSADNYSLVLGSNQFIPGFEQQLVGAKPESKMDVEVTFPEQYVKELAGKKAKFACMIHEVKTKKYPELDDEFAKGLKIADVIDMKSLEAYEEKQVYDKKLTDAKNKQFSEILNQITKNAKVTIAKQVIDGEAEQVRKEMENQITQNGLNLEQYKEITGLTDDQLQVQFRTEAETRITQSLVLNKIAETEKLVVSNDEVKDYYDNIAKQYNMKVEDVVKALQPQEDRLRQQLIQGKIERFLVANNADEEVKAEKVKVEKKEAK